MGSLLSENTPVYISFSLLQSIYSDQIAININETAEERNQGKAGIRYTVYRHWLLSFHISLVHFIERMACTSTRQGWLFRFAKLSSSRWILLQIGKTDRGDDEELTCDPGMS
jgi:hypothetical protein